MNAFLLNLLQDGEQVLLDLLLDSRLKLALHFLAVLEPLELLLSFLDYILTHEGLLGLLNSRLQKSYVDLLCSKEISHSFLLLETGLDHLPIVVSLIHALNELALVLLTALGDLLEDDTAEGISLLHHVS